jgi:serine/threonine protein kinase
MPTIYLDLTQKKNADDVYQLIHQYPETKYFVPNTPFVINRNTPNEKTLILSHMLMYVYKPAATLPPQKINLNYLHFSVIESKPIGIGGFCYIRSVLGVWKISIDQAVYKIKSEKKKRVLKSILFEPELKKVIQEEQPLDIIQARINIINNATRHLLQEAYISRFIPHLSARYPLIKTEDGVHFLLRKQRGNNLRELLIWLERNPQGLTFIQRLLLCIDLYEALGTQVHGIKIEDHTKNRVPIIHRDIKPENVMIKNKGILLSGTIIDYGLSNYKGYQSYVAFGSPIYMEPQLIVRNAPSQKTNDVFGVTMICTEIWGDQRRMGIRTTKQLIKENKNIQFKNLFSGIDCSELQEEAIRTILYKGTRFNRKERLSREGYVKAYTHQLLSAYTFLKTNNPFLNERLIGLNGFLPYYKKLSKKARSLLDQEFVATDFFISHLKQEPNCMQEFNPQSSLAKFWISYRDAQLSEVINTRIPQDIPNKLLNIIQELKEMATWPFPNSFILVSICKDWQIVKRLIDLFQNLKFMISYDYDLRKTYDEAFDEALVANRPLSEVETNIKQQLHNNLIYVLDTSDLSLQNQNRFLAIFWEALNTEAWKKLNFQKEFISAINLANLNIFYKKVCPYGGTLVIEKSQGFKEVYDRMYLNYSKQLWQNCHLALQPFFKNSQVLSLFSSQGNDSYYRRQLSHFFEKLDELLEKYENAIRILPEKIAQLMSNTIENVKKHAQVLKVNPKIEKNNPLIKALQHLLDDFVEQHNLQVMEESEDASPILNYSKQ